MNEMARRKKWIPDLLFQVEFLPEGGIVIEKATKQYYYVILVVDETAALVADITMDERKCLPVPKAGKAWFPQWLLVTDVEKFQVLPTRLRSPLGAAAAGNADDPEPTPIQVDLVQDGEPVEVMEFQDSRAYRGIRAKTMKQWARIMRNKLPRNLEKHLEAGEAFDDEEAWALVLMLHHNKDLEYAQARRRLMRRRGGVRPAVELGFLKKMQDEQILGETVAKEDLHLVKKWIERAEQKNEYLTEARGCAEEHCRKVFKAARPKALAAHNRKVREEATAARAAAKAMAKAKAMSRRGVQWQAPMQPDAGTEALLKALCPPGGTAHVRARGYFEAFYEGGYVEARSWWMRGIDGAVLELMWDLWTTHAQMGGEFPEEMKERIREATPDAVTDALLV